MKERVRKGKRREGKRGRDVQREGGRERERPRERREEVN